MNATQIKRIHKITSKGQITLPVSWRKRFNASQIIISSRGNTLEIRPISPDFYDNETTVFDAIRDNNGKGLKAKDLLKILKKIKFK